MRIFFVLLFLVLLQGCDVDSWQLRLATKICSPYGGIDKYEVAGYGPLMDTVTCMNGLVFQIKAREEYRE